MKKIRIVIILVMLLFITGCSNEILDTKSLLKPPKISNKYKEIQISLNYIFKDYSLAAPKEGANREAIYLFDLYDDEKEESIIILKDNEEYQMKIVILKKDEEDKWRKEKIFIGNGYDINKIDFNDLDGDGYKEIIVGWEGTTAISRGVSVYSLVNGEFSEVFNKRYTKYGIEDINNDETDELLIIRLDKIEGKSSAILYDLDINTKLMYYVDQVKMDGYVNNYYSIISGNVSDNKKGFLIDVSVGAHSSYTDLIIFRSGRLSNVFYNKKWEYTDITFRPYSSVSCDIDNDEILEIPLLRVPKGYENAPVIEIPFITVWMEWNGLNGLKYDVETYIDNKNNFVITFPKKWRNNITLKVEDNRYFFKYYSIQDKELYDVFEILVIDKEEYFDNRSKYSGYLVIDEKIDREYLVKISEEIGIEEAVIEYEFIKANFKYIN